MQFKTPIWKSGNSKVVTIPTRMTVEVGQEVLVTIEEVTEPTPTEPHDG